MTDTLDTKSDQELAADFAREVARLGIVESHWGDEKGNAVHGYRPVGSDPLTTPWEDVPPYCISADAVLPWLEKATKYAEIHWALPTGSANHWRVRIPLTGMSDKAVGEAPTLPRACVLALLRARRASR